MSFIKKAFLWVCTVLFILSAQSTVSFAQETKPLTLNYHFNLPLRTSKDGVSQISIEGLSNVSFSNAELPVKHVPVLLPYGKTVDHYTVTYSSTKSIANVDLPTPPKYYATSDDSISVPAGGQPADKHASEGTIMYQRGFALFIIDLFPVTYTNKTLDYVEDMQLSVSLKDADADQPTYVPTVVDTSFLPDSYACPENLATYFSQPASADTAKSTAAYHLLGNNRYDYVIITPSSFLNDFVPLVMFKRSKGVRAIAVKVEDIYNHYSGRDYAEKIRVFIRDAYSYNRVRFVLLGGDADANSGNPRSIVDYSIIPTRLLYCNIWGKGYNSASSYIASDLYYSCLDGNYDYNKNGVYGETTDGNYGRDVDLLPDVYVGRAPVNNRTEVKNFVTKTINYEKRSKKKFALLVGEKLDNSTYAMPYMEEIRRGSSSNGLFTKGFPSGYSFATLYDRTYSNHNWPVSALITQLNRSPEIIDHLGHCDNTYMMRMIPYDLNSLRNQYSFFLFSQGCYPGAYDNMQADDTYGSADAIGEQIVVKNAKTGAVACAVNSRFGWYAPASTDGPSQYFNRYMIHEYNKATRTSLGVLMGKCKTDVLARGYVGDIVVRYCYYELTLLGDPEMSLTTKVATLGNQYTLMDEDQYLRTASANTATAANTAAAPKTGDTFPLNYVVLCLILSTTGTLLLLRRRNALRKQQPQGKA